MLKDFTVSYRKRPIGLDELPRFSWKIESKINDCLQIAYKIIVKSDGIVQWDSGKVETDQSIFLSYDGIALKPMTVYDVELFVWDNHGMTYSSSSSFETGLLDQNNWHGKWITHKLDSNNTACPIFSKKVISQKVKRARLYCTSLGVYNVYLNGEKIGDDFFAPGWTSYHNRLQYQTYDLTEFFSENDSGDIINTSTRELSIMVGNGWYKGYLNGDGEKEFYGDRIALLAMLMLEHADGTVEYIGTDESWQVTTGTVRYSEIYHGEIQDFTCSGVDNLNYEDVSYAELFDATGIVKRIIAQESEPVRVTKRLSALELITTPKNEQVIDFGQNMAGLIEVKLPPINSSSNTNTLVIRHAETLDHEGNFYVDNLRTARATDTYIYGADMVGQLVMPHFTYHGFRYILVEGIEGDIDLADFTACAMHTDMKQTGLFKSNDNRINQLQSNIEWGQRSNFFDIPTDCPQRDERLGWTGDAQIFSPTAVFNFEAALFYKKWLRDVAVESDANQGIPHIVPNIVGPATGTAVWSDCATIIPWIIYMAYGDEEVLIEQYDNMKLWVEYIRREADNEVLWMNGFQRGDWLSLDIDESLRLMSGGTDKNLVANVYYAYSTWIMCQTAKVLKRNADAADYQHLYDDIVGAINEEYITSRGRIVSETQTACALLLHFNLVKASHRARVIKILEDNLVMHKGHLTTGFVGTAYLNHALTDNGRHSLATDLLFKNCYPGWLYQIKQDATTIWERWNSILPDGRFDESGMNSLNHYSFGAIGDWLYKKVAGISPLMAGYKRILIAPTLTPGLSYVEASLETMYGTVACKLRCENDLISVEICIPANTTALLILPEQNEPIQVGSGVYEYKYETKTNLKTANFSMNSKIDEILLLENGYRIIEKHMPGIISGSMFAYIKSKSLNELALMAPNYREDLMKLVDDLKSMSSRSEEFMCKDHINNAT